MPADAQRWPKFDDAKRHLMKGKTLNLLGAILKGHEAIAGDGIRLHKTEEGVRISATAQETSVLDQLWQVVFTDGGVYIQVPRCVIPGNDPPWTVGGDAVDYFDPTANFIAISGRKFLVLELTVDDTGPLQIDVSGVEIKAVDEGDEATQTLTVRRIPICGVDADAGYVTPSYLSGAIQIRRWGNRNDPNNLIWQVT